VETRSLAAFAVSIVIGCGDGEMQRRKLAVNCLIALFFILLFAAALHFHVDLFHLIMQAVWSGVIVVLVFVLNT
jgi:hypothetical protein